MEINTIIQFGLTIATGVITFFLKRTINDLDNCKSDIMDIKEDYVRNSQLNECKNDIVKIKSDYITKEDFFREQGDNKERLNRITDILLEIKGENHNG